MLGLGVVVQQIMEIGYFGCLVLADVFLDELNLVAEFGFREFGDGTVEGVDRQMMIGKELIPDEILFETDIVADTSGEQGIVFDAGDIGNGVTAVTPAPDSAFREW